MYIGNGDRALRSHLFTSATASARCARERLNEKD